MTAQTLRLLLTGTVGITISEDRQLLNPVQNRKPRNSGGRSGGPYWAPTNADHCETGLDSFGDSEPKRYLVIWRDFDSSTGCATEHRLAACAVSVTAIG